MIRNYVTIALRVLIKNRLYAAINICGLALGLAIFLISQVLADYEYNYDNFFEHSDNIYVPYIELTPGGPLGEGTMPTIPTAARVVLENIAEIEEISWSIGRDHVVRYEEQKFYENIKFLDREFFDIFDIEFLYGSRDTAIAQANSISLSKRVATKYFGSENPLGKILTLDGTHNFIVSGVYRDLPKNSHFTNSMAGFSGFDLVSSLDGFNQLEDFDLRSQWGSMSSSEITYVKLAENVDLEQLNVQIDQKYTSLVPERIRQVFQTIRFRHVSQLNLYLWDMIGIPAITVMQWIGFLVLLVVVFNYTILAYAQALGRVREVGIRKSLGASRKNIFLQFITESTLLTMVAAIIAVAIIEMALPFLNDASNRNIEFNLTSQTYYLVLLIATVLVAGFATGLYPAVYLSRLTVSKILSGITRVGAKSEWIKNTLLVCQFTVSAVLITGAGIISLQNMKLDEAANRFDRENIINIHQFRDEMRSDYNALRLALENIDGVRNVAGASQVPFLQDQNMRPMGITRAKEDEVLMLQFDVEETFLDLYSVNIVAGRGLSRDRGDVVIRDAENLEMTIPLVINELASREHGWTRPEDAIGQVLRSPEGSTSNHQYRVIGVAEDRNFLDHFSEVMPMTFMLMPESFNAVSIELDGRDYAATTSQIREVWDQFYPAYPIVIRGLNEEFEETFGLLRTVNMTIISLSIATIIFALIGLFGLSAYMVERRRKEIAVRKVMGAKVKSIIGLFIWQFSKPMLAALCLAIPFSIFAAGQYLELFSVRAEIGLFFYSLPIIFILSLTWSVVTVHAARVARENPILALRSE